MFSPTNLRNLMLRLAHLSLQIIPLIVQTLFPTDLFLVKHDAVACLAMKKIEQKAQKSSIHYQVYYNW